MPVSMHGRYIHQGPRGYFQKGESSDLGSEGPVTQHASRFGTSSHDTILTNKATHLKCRVTSPPERFAVTTFLHQFRYSQDNSECNKC